MMTNLKSEYGHKIIYDRYGWATDKAELRNRGLQLLGRDFDYILVVDGDEVWKQEDLDNLIKAFKKHPEAGVFWFPAYHFWKKPDLIAVGSQWDKHLFRCFKYSDKSLHWGTHEAPVIDGNGIGIDKQGTVTLRNVHFYHYGAMKPEHLIKDKLKYYKERDKDLTVVNTWSNWEKGKPTQWTHGGGTVKEFTGIHPEEVKNYLLI